MVRELERERQTNQVPENAPAANPVFSRTYSRRTAAGRETLGAGMRSHANKPTDKESVELVRAKMDL